MLIFSVSFQFYRMRRFLHRSCTQRGARDPLLERSALVAQWIEHQTSNLGVAGSSPARGIRFPFLGVQCSGSLVVMTSALHAEGREFNPRPEYFLLLSTVMACSAGMAKWQGNRFVSGRSRVRSPLPALLTFFLLGSRDSCAGVRPCTRQHGRVVKALAC
jgi:hypothetical protein